jgi:hypothetical protein
MKKIILGITVIAVTLLIFGCGKVQSANSSGGGSSGGGGNAFSISGTVSAPEDLVALSLPKRIGQYLADLFVSPLYAEGWLAALPRADVVAYVFGTENVAGRTTTGADGKYTISGIDKNKVHTIVVTKAGSNIELKSLFVNDDSGKKTDVTPISTLVAEAVSANGDAQEFLKDASALNKALEAVNAVQTVVEEKCSDPANRENLKKIADSSQKGAVLTAELNKVASDVNTKMTQVNVEKIVLRLPEAWLTGEKLVPEHSNRLSVNLDGVFANIQNNYTADVLTDIGAYYGLAIREFTFVKGAGNITITYLPEENDGQEYALGIVENPEVGVSGGLSRNGAPNRGDITKYVNGQAASFTLPADRNYGFSGFWPERTTTYNPSPADIVINGNNSDWDNVPYVFASGNKDKIGKVKIAKRADNNKYYFALELDGTPNTGHFYSFCFTNGWPNSYNRSLEILVYYNGSDWITMSNGNGSDNHNVTDVECAVLSKGVEIAIPVSFLAGFPMPYNVYGFRITVEKNKGFTDGWWSNREQLDDTRIIPLKVE